jgi:RNA polymerase sigma factor (sigma-70 family)
MASDDELLRCYARDRSEEAFAELVRRHLRLVYFAAWRRTNGDGGLAEEVAQQVFVTLAREASRIERRSVLAGWLYVATRHAAAKAMRADGRRRAREQAVFLMQETSNDGSGATDWERLRPDLDRVLDDLGERDRDAVLLRFFENRPFAEIGAILRVSEDAARMRVDRALERMRGALARRGVTSTTAALALAFEPPAGAALPSTLLSTVSGAVAAGLASGGTGSTAAVAAFAFMSPTKIITSVAGAIAFLSIGAALYEVRQAHELAVDADSLRLESRALTARNGELQRELQELRSPPPAAPATPALARGTAPTPAGRDLSADPEVRRLQSQKLAADLELNVHAFFTKLGFSAEQWEKYKAIVVGELELERDAGAAGRAHGLSTQEEERLMAQSATEARNNLRSLLGEEASQRLIQWNQERAIRNTAEQLAAGLVYSDEPLATPQAEQFVKIVRDAQGIRRGANGFAFIGDEALSQLRNVLSPLQFSLLQQQQLARRTEQQIAARLGK